MKTPSLIQTMRQWIAKRLGLNSRDATNGSWWEVDLILVFLLGVFCLGLVAALGVLTSS